MEQLRMTREDKIINATYAYNHGRRDFRKGFSLNDPPYDTKVAIKNWRLGWLVESESSKETV